MKKWITGAAMVALAMGCMQRADASLFVTISDNLGTKTCDNSTAAGVTACVTAGFTTSLNDNNIGFSNLTVGGYTFGGNSGVNADVPGTANFSLVSDSKLNVTHNTASTDLTITFAALGFTLPVGPNMTFSASDTGNWALDTSANEFGAFSAWANAANTTATSGTLAATPNCNGSAIPTTTFACQTTSGDVGFTRGAGAFSLVGQEVLHMGVGSVASFTAQEVVSAVPEPVTFSLMGVGLLGLGLLRKRIGRS